MGLLLGEALGHQPGLGPGDPVPLLLTAPVGLGLDPGQQLLHRAQQLAPGGRGAQAQDLRVPHQVQLTPGGHHQHVAEGGQVLIEQLRRAVGKPVAADHRLHLLPMDGAAHLVGGGAQQAVGRTRPLQELPDALAVLQAGKGHDHLFHIRSIPLGWAKDQ